MQYVSSPNDPSCYIFKSFLGPLVIRLKITLAQRIKEISKSSSYKGKGITCLTDKRKDVIRSLMTEQTQKLLPLFLTGIWIIWQLPHTHIAQFSASLANPSLETAFEHHIAFKHQELLFDYNSSTANNCPKLMAFLICYIWSLLM